MYYSELAKLYKTKFSSATIQQCDFAISDIDQTLKLYPGCDTSHPYVEKLFCERDAALDRKMVLNRKRVK